MNRIAALLILMASFLQVHAQNLDRRTIALRKHFEQIKSVGKFADVIVQGQPENIRLITEISGGRFKYNYGNLSVVSADGHCLEALLESKLVERISIPTSSFITMNDSMRSSVHVNAVHAGVAPLNQSYDGNGVVVGIIDTGVDLTHPDLQDSTGNTRVKFLWDQRKPIASNTPIAYGYGQEWNDSDINSGLAASSNDQQGYGHGTHVTGIAAGDGSANGKNKGIAPKADIIEVAFDFTNTTNTTILDAVDFILNKAQQLGKPCVINASLGSYDGSHDGYDLESQMINNMLTQQPGRAMVAAAGNAGNIPFHLGYNATSDTSFTWIRYNPAYPSTYLQLWGDTADFPGIHFAVGADASLITPSFRGKTSFGNFSYFNGINHSDSIFNSSGDRIAIVESFGSIQGSVCLIEMLIRPDSASYNWRLMSTGSGRFDIWKFYDGTYQPGFQISGLPSISTLPDMAFYKLPDLNSTIVSGFQCLDKVITVANHGNRSFYVDLNGNTYTDPNVTSGQIVANSSKGPTRDGRIKPDISAPGSITLSCGQLSLMAIWQTQPTNVIKIAEGGYHIRDGGTSSASPVVAGVAALYLQQNPTATALQVKNAITQCAIQDVFTGTNLPDNIWGFGKVDALNTLLNCSLSSIHSIEQTSASLSLYPNPAFAGEIISAGLSGNSETGEQFLILSDLTGRELRRKLMTSNVSDINTSGLSAGIYQIRIVQDRQTIGLSRLILIN